MKKTLGAVFGVALLAMGSGQAFADEAMDLKVGKKVYDRAFGRGCGACHDISSNPQLVALIKDGSLTKAKFAEVVLNGRNGMPKAGDAIMAVSYVEKKGYSLDQAVDATYVYLQSLAK